MSDRKMTYDEWRQESLVRECTSTGHTPAEKIRTMGSSLGTYYCGCGEVIWTPKSRS